MRRKKSLWIILEFALLIALFLFTACDTKQTTISNTSIKSNLFTIEGNSLYTKVSNETTFFSFQGAIEVAANASYTISTDMAGENIIRSKAVELSVGDNTYYIIVENGNDVALYIATIRRKAMYKVTFMGYDGSIWGAPFAYFYQDIEEDGLVSEPTDSIIMKKGYEFNGWNFDFSTPVTQDTIIMPKMDRIIRYSVEYDLNDQNLFYKAENPNNLTECTINDVPKSPSAKGYLFKGWKVNYYDDKNKIAKFTATWESEKYNISYNFNDDNSKSKVQNRYSFPSYYTVESEISFDIPIRSGYDFIEWDIPNIEKGTYGEKIINAYWHIIDYSITYVLNDCKNSENNPTSFSVEDLPFNLEKATPPDGIFKGWYTDNTVNSKSFTTIDAVGNKTIYALWGGTDGVKYALSYDETYYSVYDYTGDSYDVVIRNYYNSKPVRKISDSAFKNCNRIRTLTIPNNVTYIGQNLFKDYTKLTGIYIKDLVKWGEIDFKTDLMLYAENLYIDGKIPNRDYIIPDGVTVIPNGTFKNCHNLTSIIIPNSVTKIGKDVFYGCSSLVNITIPFVGEKAACTSDDIKYPFGYLFGHSSYKDSEEVVQYNQSYSLESVDIKSVTYYIPSSLRSVTVNGETIPSNAFCRCSMLTSITFDNATTIDDYAFYNTGITKLIIPDSVTDIGICAFRSCRKLTDISIGKNVRRIFSSVFYDCTGIVNISVSQENLKYHSSNNCIVETQSKVLIIGCKNSIIPVDGTVTKIGDGAFCHCRRLSNITIPEGIISIGSQAFSGCAMLTSVTIPEGIISIESKAFSECSMLTNITIPESLTTIKNDAFYECNGLIGVHITNIEKWSAINFGNYHSNPLYYAHNLYLNGEIVASLTIPDGANTISNYAFAGCSSLASVIIPSSVTSIGEGAFYGCSSLESIQIPFVGARRNANNGYDYVFGYIFGYTITNTKPSSSMVEGAVYQYSAVGGGKYYLYYVPLSLKTVVICSDDTIIPYWAFWNCIMITNVTVGEGIVSIKDYAFYGCTGLTSVTIGDSVTEIKLEAFYRCIGLKKIYIGSGLTSIDKWCFAHCSELAEIHYKGTISQWNSIAKGTGWNSDTGEYVVYCKNGNTK